MKRAFFCLSVVCAACGSREQSPSARTVAAFEVPVPSADDRTRLLALLSAKAKAAGYHVDAASADELAARSKVSPQTFNATVWRGEDEESIASAMDFEFNLGRVWITFPRGEDPERSRAFRESLMPVLETAFPDTAKLPIMPNGAIPFVEDMTRSANGYVVKPSAAGKYAATPAN